jgi:hypothetical protein
MNGRPYRRGATGGPKKKFRITSPAYYVMERVLQLDLYQLEDNYFGSDGDEREFSKGSLVYLTLNQIGGQLLE